MLATPRQTIIAVCNEKGGTAKTTTSVTLSAALGELGQKVLLVDLDGQAASSRWMGIENDNRLAEALARGGGLEPVMDVKKNVSLAPASGKLDSIAHDLRPTQGGQLRKVLGEMTQFDYVLIDCPPSLGNRLIGNALLAASHVIVPVETSILALDGLKILLTTLADVREGFDHDLRLGGVLACRFDGRTRLSRMVVAELQRALPGRVFDTVIREAVRMRECPASGQTIFEFAPECHAAADYLAVAREMIDSPQRWRRAQRTVDDILREQSMTQDFSMTDIRGRTAAFVCNGRGDAHETDEPTEPAADETPPEADPVVEPVEAMSDCLTAAPQEQSTDAATETDWSVPLVLQNAPAEVAPEPEPAPAADQEFAAFLERLTVAEEKLKSEKTTLETEPSQGLSPAPAAASWELDVSQQIESQEMQNPDAAGALRVRIFAEETDTPQSVDVHDIPAVAAEQPPQPQDDAPAPQAPPPPAPDAHCPPETDQADQSDSPETLDFQSDPGDGEFPALRALHSKLVSEGRITPKPPQKPSRGKNEKRRGLWRAWTRK